MLLHRSEFFGVGVRAFIFPVQKRRAKCWQGSLCYGKYPGHLGLLAILQECSAINRFLGFFEAGIPLGVTFSFLIKAPLINEWLIIVLLVGLFSFGAIRFAIVDSVFSLDALSES